MEPFIKFTAAAVPFDLANVDTDKIIPARFLRKRRSEGYGQFLFHDIRRDEAGNQRPDFVLNQPGFRDAKIVVGSINFGCGSSRVGAVYALEGCGFRCVIAPSMGDIFFDNCIENGVLPVILSDADCAILRAQLNAQPGATITADLENKQIIGPDGKAYAFDIVAEKRERLLKGLDDIGLVMEHIGAIEAFEKRHHAEQPWLA